LPNDFNSILKPYLAESVSPKVDLSHFKILKKIGAGGFSVVYLVKKKDSGNFYAMKVIDK
jgi:serum/glucocorticoid-regulated kinase 2